MRLVHDRVHLGRAAMFFVVCCALLGAMAAGPISVAEDEAVRSGRPLFPSTGIWFEQIVTHPRSDWQGDARVSSLDEHIVLRNHGSDRVEMSGWMLRMVDSTDEEIVLEGGLDPGEPWVVMNPPGRINNDVSLRLVDAEGVLVDRVDLGVEGIPDGRGDSVLDEAVHLTGPWAGLRGPGALDLGLGPLWVSHLAAMGSLDHQQALQPGWVDPEGSVLEMRLVLAPGFDPGPLEVRVGDHAVGLQPVDQSDGVWRSVDALGPFAENRSIELVGADRVVTTFPSGAALDLFVDPVEPSFVGIDWPPGGDGEPFRAAVADAQGRVRWFPPVEAGPSGLLRAQVRNGQDDVLEDCVPLGDPGPGCVVAEEGNVSVRLEDHAGRVHEGPLPVLVWDTPPGVPEVAFESGGVPGLVWAHPSRPVRSLVMEVAEGPDGSWMLDEQQMEPDARRFVDQDWSPGEPRAYRLRATDLAGNEGVGAWVVLEPEDVPVQVGWDEPMDLGMLGHTGEASVVLRFDRPLAEAPVLTLRLERPHPLYLEVQGDPIVSEDAYVYQVELPTLIEEAVGSWSVEGGRGEDGAPVDGPTKRLTWDARAPSVKLFGAPEGWVSSPRHVVTVQAVDAIDPDPVVSFAGLPSGVIASGEGASSRLVLKEEGFHEVEGTVRDASGNERAFLVRLLLDAAAPVVKEVERPAVWSAGAPVLIQVHDEGAGVNQSSLKVWARDRIGVFEVHQEAHDNHTWAVSPVDRPEPVEGPFELYVAVADQAGNGVEGFLSKRMVRVPALENASAPVKVVPGQGPAAVRAPSFLGPPWGAHGERGDASIGSLQNANASQGASRWDGFSWDDVPEEEEKRSWAWYVVAFVGAVTLGTAAHRVRSKRNRSMADKNPAGGTRGPEDLQRSGEINETGKADGEGAGGEGKDSAAKEEGKGDGEEDVDGKDHHSPPVERSGAQCIGPLDAGLVVRDRDDERPGAAGFLAPSQATARPEHLPDGRTEDPAQGSGSIQSRLDEWCAPRLALPGPGVAQSGPGPGPGSRPGWEGEGSSSFSASFFVHEHGVEAVA